VKDPAQALILPAGFPAGPAPAGAPAAAGSPGEGLSREFSLLFRRLARERLKALGEGAAAAVPPPPGARPAPAGREAERPLPALSLAGLFLRAFRPAPPVAGPFPAALPLPAGEAPGEAVRAAGHPAAGGWPAAGGPVPGSPPPPAPLPPAAERVVRAVVSLVGGRGRLVVRLHPPRLGTVWVRVSSAGGRLRVEVKAERPQARGLLLRAAAEMRRRLEEAGLAVDRFDVTGFENQGRRDRREGEGRRRGAGTE